MMTFGFFILGVKLLKLIHEFKMWAYVAWDIRHSEIKWKRT